MPMLSSPRKPGLLVLLALLLGLGCGRDDEPVTNISSLESCLEGVQKEMALLPAGSLGENEALIAMGRRLSPVGRLAVVPYFPLGVALSPDGEYAYVVHSGRDQMEVIDTASGNGIQNVPGVGGFRGVVAGHDGEFVYSVGAAAGTVSRLKWNKGKLHLDQQMKLQGAPTDVILSPDGGTLIVVSGANSKVWEMAPRSFSVLNEYVTRGVYPYTVALTPDERHLITSHVGSDTVSFVSRATGEVVAAVPVGLNPMGLAVDAKRNLVYAVNSDSDTVSVLSLSKFAVVKTIDLTHNPDGLAGGSANEIVLSPDLESAYVSFADLNRVDIYALADWSRSGSIPTAYYPTGIALAGDGSLLAVANSKGWGGVQKLHHELCVVSLVDLPPSAETLAEWTKVADENVERTGKFWDETCPDPVPLPLDQDEDQVVEHVVLIVRENKTYDTLMGDFERGNGDPALVVFGEEYTPNLHEIARAFVNMDNYYVDSQESLQGHTWTTQADCNDFFEKLYPKDPAQIIFFSYDPSSVAGEKTIFDHCFELGVTFRNYGEFEGFSSEMMGLYKDFINQKFPFYNLAIKDVWKAEEFIRELELGILPEFVYIALPNDHTAGGKPGFPSPASMVADNDEATGMIVDALSRSPFWDSTTVFIIEDDPQGYGGDHVHSHRSICVAAGPWVRREYTSSVHYSIPALYKTIELLLRMPPMRKNDALAPPMYDIFVTGDEDDPPDYSGFEFIPRLVPETINKVGDYMWEESMKFNLSRPDASPGLGYVVWRIMKGDEEPPPYAKWKDR